MRSRMSREAHVQICESLGVRSPWATRLLTLIRKKKEGEQLIVKIKSHVSENEIYDGFGRINKIFNQKKVRDYFFKETEGIVDKICDYFEATIKT